MKILTTLAILTCASTAIAQEGWTVRNDAPLYWADYAAVTVAGNVHVIAGWDTTTSVNAHYEFDPVSGAWTSRAAHPTAVEDLAAAVLNGRIYTFGGTDFDVVYSTVYEYDPATSAWTLQPAMPTARFGAVAAVVGSQIIVAGGENDLVFGNALTTVEAFTPGIGWSDLASLRRAVSYPYGGAIGGRMYVAGGSLTGWFNFEPSNGLQILDVAANTWTDGPTVSPNYAGGSAVIGGALFCFGGLYANVTQEYRPSSNRWTTRLAPPVNVLLTTSAPVGNKAYMVAGFSTTGSYTLEYTAPSTGSAPHAPTGLAQNHVAGTGIDVGGYAHDIAFAASITDDDRPVELIRLEVEVIRQGTPFAGTPTAAGPLGTQGLCTVTVSGLAEGAYQWRARAVDEYENASAWVAFDPDPRADFRVDTTPPGTPSPLSPVGFATLLAPTSAGLAVDFLWTAVTDPGGVIAGYEIEVASQASFAGPIAATTFVGPAGTITLPPSATPWFWHVRAVDAAGNVGAWSSMGSLYVVVPDTANHAAGDAERVCGFSATGTSCGILVLLCALLVRRR